MTWPLIVIISGVLVTVALWAIFVYIAIREIRTDMPIGSFAESLDVLRTDQPVARKVQFLYVISCTSSIRACR